MIKNTNKFRQAAIHFQKYGYYTIAPVGTSAFKEYWDEESRRCLYGYNADSDGDFITGYHYFYLNYTMISIVEEISVTIGGEVKKIPQRKRNFPSFYDSDYQYFMYIDQAERVGQNAVVLKKRRAGYSWKAASMLCRNFYLMPGSIGYAVASEAEFLTKDGVLSKAWDLMSWIDSYTAWTKKRQKVDTKMHKRASYIVDSNGTKIESGFLSEIMGITVKNDVQKIRGKVGKLILFEEAGKFPNLKEAWQIAESSVRQGSNVFGTMIAYGTGGTEGADYEGLKALFYECDGYNVLSVDNIWDEGATKKCGFFVPECDNMEGVDSDGNPFMDSDGNSIQKVAISHILKERQKVIDNATDRNAIDRYIAEHPLNPMEATLQISGNIFPKKDLIRHLAYIRNNNSIMDYRQVGSLYFDSTGLVKWKLGDSKKDLRRYKLDKNSDREGAIVVWEHPVNNPAYGLYIAGCLTSGEKVYTDKGLKNVEDVTLEDKLINKEGKLVDINTLLRYEKVNEPIYKVHISNIDRPTIYTQEHPLYLSNSIDSEFKFILTKDVKEGMWTKYPNFYSNTKEIPFELWDKYKSKRNNKDINPIGDEDFWWFVGHWLGDGFNNKQGENYTIYSSFGLDEKEYVDKYKSIVSRLFSRNPNLKLQNGNNTHKFEYKQLYLFLEDNFGKYASGKYISEWVKYLPDNLKHHLILGYLDSDGTVYKDKTTIRSTFKSINRKLLNDIQDILFSIGITSSFNLSDLMGTYNINGKTGTTKESYALRVNQTQLKKLADKFNYDYHSRKLRIAKDIEFKQKPKISDSCIISEDNKYIYLKINKIEKFIYSGTVYNFDCETHTFITQYCTGHNCDPYDHDKSGTDSLGSVFIYKRFQTFEHTYDTIVAEYTGRPDTAEMFYENVRKLLMYYNATVLYENQWPGLSVYMRNKHCDHLLADQPDIISKIIRDSRVQRGKGIHMNTEIKDFGEGKLRDWLIEEYEPGKKNLTKIYSEPLLEELIAYNDKGNFDRVIAMFMIMLYKEELHDLKVKAKESTEKSKRLFETPIFGGSLQFNEYIYY